MKNQWDAFYCIIVFGTYQHCGLFFLLCYFSPDCVSNIWPGGISNQWKWFSEVPAGVDLEAVQFLYFTLNAQPGGKLS